MSRDRLREEGQKGTLERVGEFGVAALALGAGAAAFYRTGGGSLLSKAASVSQRVLRESGDVMATMKGRKVSTGEVADAFKSLISGDNSVMKKAMADHGKRIELRRDNPNSLIGKLQDAIANPMKSMNAKIQSMYENEYVKVPVANKFVKELGSNDPSKAENIERFIHEITGRSGDERFLEESLKKYKIEEDFGPVKAMEMVSHVEERMREKRDFQLFKQNKEQVFSLARREALDPDNIALSTGMRGRKGQGDFSDTVLGDRRVTVDDLLRNPEKFKDNLVSFAKEDESGDAVASLEEITDVLKRTKEEVAEIHGEGKAIDFGNLYVDNFLRLDASGDFISLSPLANAFDGAMEKAGDTIVGQVLKTRNYAKRKMAPSFYFTLATAKTADPILAAMGNKVDKKALSPDQNYLRIYEKTYRVGENSLEHVKELDGTFLTSAKDSRAEYLNQMMGNTDYRVQDNALFRLLDIGQGGVPNYGSILKAKLSSSKYHKSSENAIKGVATGAHETLIDLSSMEDSKVISDHRERIFEITDQIKEVNKFYSRNSKKLSKEIVHQMSSASSGQTKEYLEALKLGDEDLATWLMNKVSSSIADETTFRNSDLVTLSKQYMNDPRRMREQFSLRSDSSGAKKASGFFDILRIELGKEAFMTEAANSDKGYNAVKDLISNTTVNAPSKESAKWLSQWAAFQDEGEITGSFTKDKDLRQLVRDAKRVVEMFLVDNTSSVKDAEFLSEMKRDLASMSKRGAKDFDESYRFFKESTDLISAKPANEYVHVRKMHSPIDAIKNLNDGEKVKAFFKQFVAGRDDPSNITNATFFPYFAISRMPEALGKIGLNFSPSSSGSVGELSKSIMLKRIMPVALGVTAFSYLNDVSEDLSGTSMTGAMASGIARIDLGMRSLTDATGLTGFIKAEKEINPLLSYWTGDEYMDREEREDWYRNGYQEVRRARWWNFGSINELRGSSIQYYQPNYLRRAHSDWKDRSLYDSHKEKWSRSIIPTGYSPLSPLRFLANPYWLEEKHAEDRPYPVSAPLFSEESPWGVVLNPTLGEIIKPRKLLHQDRLDGRLVDVKSIIEARNIQSFEKAKSKHQGHVVRFRDGTIEPVDYTTLQAPTASQRVLSFNSFGGEIQRINEPGSYQQVTGLENIQGYTDGQEATYAPTVGTPGGSGGGPSEGGVAFSDRVQFSSATGGIFSGAISRAFGGASSPGYDIESINEGIKARARLANSKADERGIVTPESISRRQARYGRSILDNEEARSDLRGLASGDDFIGELAYTSRYIAGIYGYGSHMAFEGAPRTKLDDAGQMRSASRAIWESNIGGLGGEYAEIFRRFLPDRNHMVDRINPLMNTMPDWMPERFRFGDPYTVVPKGEMRLPGKGYESLHQLNPDMYGEYGAYDRFKILADIAPGSVEYKTWRDIAGKTVRDPLLREEMKSIKDRVANQSKKYDFSNYKFLGSGVERKSAMVEEVLNNNYFKIMGDDRVFRMAGISVGDTEEGISPLKEMLAPGMEITLATDKSEYSGVNDDEYQSVNAAVFTTGNLSINKQLLDSGMATRRKNDMSAAASEGVYTDFQRTRGHIYEALAHLPIPYFSQKYFRIRDPLESYKQEMVFGTPYASWAKPIDSFLKPAFERSLMSNTEFAVGAGAFMLNSFLQNKEGVSHGARKVARTATLLSNRGAFIGNFLGRVAGKGAPADMGMKLGAAAQAAAWVVTRRDQPLVNIAGSAGIGAYVGNMFSDIGKGKGALIGAGIGALVSSGSNIMDGDINEEYIPERTRKKWEIQEYFDRLNYIKYEGLYEKAARKAKSKEGTDIKEIIQSYERSRAENEKMRAELEKQKEILSQNYGAVDSGLSRAYGEIEEKLALLNEEELLVKTGEYGRAALMYKQAMDSTNYGLKTGATWSQLLRALPSHERDHFMEFAKETDPDKQDEILKYVSPHQRRALQIAWGRKVDEQESMLSYFSDRHLPRPTWSGWRPNVDLKNIEVKTIYNEGMMLSDFGYYDSETRKPEVINADSISPNAGFQNGLSIRSRLAASLEGAGLFGVDVRVEPTNSPGIQVVADVIRSETYSLKSRVEEFFRM